MILLILYNDNLNIMGYIIDENEACALLLLYKCRNIKIDRNTLRTILKNNNISYHKSGPKNQMKTKTEMQNIVNNIALMKIKEILQHIHLSKNNILL